MMQRGGWIRRHWIREVFIGIDKSPLASVLYVFQLFWYINCFYSFGISIKGMDKVKHKNCAQKIAFHF